MVLRSSAALLAVAAAALLVSARADLIATREALMFTNGTAKGSVSLAEDGSMTLKASRINLVSAGGAMRLPTGTSPPFPCEADADAEGAVFFDTIAMALRVCANSTWALVHASETGECACSGTSAVLGSLAYPATSCEAILANDPSAQSTVYWLQPASTSNVFQSFCDMGDGVVGGSEAGGGDGGWALALRAKNPSSTFTFASSYWTDAVLLNSGTTLAPSENADAKFQAFTTSPITELRACFKHRTSGVWSCLTRPAPFAGQTLLHQFTTTVIGHEGTSGAGWYNGETVTESLEWLTIMGLSAASISSGNPPGFGRTSINGDDTRTACIGHMRFGAGYNNEVDSQSLNDAVGFGASSCNSNPVGSGASVHTATRHHIQGTLWVR